MQQTEVKDLMPSLQMDEYVLKRNPLQIDVDLLSLEKKSDAATSRR
jgi:hypothetical protein